MLGSWFLIFWTYVRSWGSWTLQFWFCVGSWGSWILIFGWGTSLATTYQKRILITRLTLIIRHLKSPTVWLKIIFKIRLGLRSVTVDCLAVYAWFFNTLRQLNSLSSNTNTFSLHCIVFKWQGVSWPRASAVRYFSQPAFEEVNIVSRRWISLSNYSR